MKCVSGNWHELNKISGCGSVWLEYLIWDQGVAGSNPVIPTNLLKLNNRHGPLAQWLEHPAHNRQVLGSNPRWPTR